MDKPEKEVKSKGEIRRFFNTKVVKSEKVVIGGKTMYMTIDKIDDSGKEVKRKKNTNSKIREKHMELKFPQIDYKIGFNKLDDDDVNDEIITLVTGTGKKPIKHPLSYNPLAHSDKFPLPDEKDFEKLSEVETYLEKKIESFTNPTDSEIIDIFHKIQCWGGKMGKGVYQDEGFDKNFKMNVYKDMVNKCLNFDLENDWVNEVSDWTIDLKDQIDRFGISFATKHIRFWLYKKLKDNAPPIFDEVILGKKDEYNKRWISGLNKYQEYPFKNNTSKKNLRRYWEQMIKKSKKEKISLKQLERILFNYFKSK